MREFHKVSAHVKGRLPPVIVVYQQSSFQGIIEIKVGGEAPLSLSDHAQRLGENNAFRQQGLFRIRAEQNFSRNVAKNPGKPLSR